jgi:hypothetical protein
MGYSLLVTATRACPTDLVQPFAGVRILMAKPTSQRMQALYPSQLGRSTLVCRPVSIQTRTPVLSTQRVTRRKLTDLCSAHVTVAALSWQVALMCWAIPTAGEGGRALKAQCQRPTSTSANIV